MQPTLVKRQELYKDRWSSFGANTGILKISETLSPNELKKFEIFRDYDDGFLEKISPDVSVARWKERAILFEEGSYIDLAFFVVAGSVEVYLQQHAAEPYRPIFDVNRTMMAEGKGDALGPASFGDDGSGAGPARSPQLSVLQAQVQKHAPSKSDIVFLSAMDFDLPFGDRLKLGPGEIFGEIGAANGWPQSITAQTATECELVQIRVAALRLMKRKSPVLKERVDKLYRERSLFSQLKATPLFQNCDTGFIDALSKKVELVSCEADEAVIREGEPVDAFYLVRSGFVKLLQKVGEGQMVVSYLSKGMTLGEIELLTEGTPAWMYTATSVGNSELVKILRDDFFATLKKFPNLEKQLWSMAVARIKEVGATKQNLGQSEFIDTALHFGLVEGNSILMIDLNVCTRCDECVRACADTHGGRPRFVREGDRLQNYLITRACFHCRDPLCLVGCPTGAIRRTNVGEVVAIDDKLCIGCQSCAKNCPFDAITMHQTGETWPDNMLPEALRGTQRLLATKCDLCSNTGHGPACVINCPHGCAVRIGSVEEVQRLMH